MAAVINPPPKPASDNLSNDELDTLRRLLLGPEYKELLQHKTIQEDPEKLAKHLSSAITQALQTRDERDGSVQHFFTPILEKSLTDSVLANPKPITDALYPVIAPAIRKTINVSLSQMIDNMNELLENSLSPRSFRWRFDAWRTGKSYAEIVFANKLIFQVEQVFLVHRETGLPLQHVVSNSAVSKDPDIVAGMLTAIQDFLKDSFVTEKNSDLDTLKLGDLTLLLEHSPTAVIAVVVRGTVPSRMQQTLAEVMENIHQQEYSALNEYNGDTSQFDHLLPLLSSCLVNQLREPAQTKEEKSSSNAEQSGSFKKKPLAVALGLCTVTALGYFGYNNHIENQQWDDLQHALRSEPGIILSHSSDENGVYQLHGLVDSMAKSPKALIDEHIKNKQPIESHFRPYLSLEPTFVQQRISKALLPPDTALLTLDDEVLHISGVASLEWVTKLKLAAPLFAGVSEVNLDKLATIDSQQSLLQSSVQ